MKRRDLLKSGGAIAGLLVAGGAPFAATARDAMSGDPLIDGFLRPPPEARPRVWWHWVNGNVSREGVLADLAWMKRVGIAGFTMFDAAFRFPPTPVVVDEPLIFHSPAWREVVATTAAEAARLDLDFGVHIAGGWSESGGPWVQPQQAMKKLAWSETIVEGGRPLTVALPTPPDASGPFLDYPTAADLAEPRLYRDVAVVAFPAPEEAEPPSPMARSNGGAVDADALADGSYATAHDFSAPDGEPLILTYDYPRAWPVGSITVSGSPGVPNGRVEVSEDGQSFKALLALPGPAEKGAPVRTFGFAPVLARSLRVVIDRPADGRVTLRQLAFRSGARVNRFEDKSGLGTLADHEAVATPPALPETAIASREVLDLSDRLAADGRLDWTPPPGRWVVQRFGYTLTGKRNGPATPAATGLEADKLNAAHVRSHLDGFFGPLLEAVGDNHGQRGLRHAIVDSWEAGQQNWTEAMPDAFRQRRGYALTAFLPALTGRIVDDAESSDRLLADFRATIGDLLADNHYAVVRDFVHGHGLYLYGESMGVDLPTVGDGLRLKGLSDIPTGEFWAQVDNAPPLPTHVADIREAASAAHIYGRTIVAAEAFTTLDEVPAWSMGPRDLKPVADRFLGEGVNRFIIHTSPHQPFLDRAPGITLRRYGQHFSRHEAWAEQAGGWLDYLSRSAFILQRGRSVADLAIFYGEGAPVAAPYRSGLVPEIPSGFDYDYVNAEVLADATVRDGRIVLASGASYRVLMLPPGVKRLSPELAGKFEALVRDGGVLLGERPIGAVGRVADEASARLERSLDALWGAGGEPDRRVGRGRVLRGLSAAEAFAHLDEAPDFLCSEKTVAWKHRRDGRTDIYFVADLGSEGGVKETSFRVSGATPEVWRAIDGGRTAVASRVEGDRTVVSLDLRPGEAVFVVFADARAAGTRPIPESPTPIARIEGPWRVTFQPGRGVSGRLTFDRLTSWTDQADFDVRHFSGVATYATTFQAPAVRSGRLLLDLGEVGEMGRVHVNGRALGVVWTSPFRLDITDAVRPGENRLEIEVANFWHNRLVGDLQPGVKPVGFTTVSYYAAETPLRPSGLLGPVTLMRTGAQT